MTEHSIEVSEFIDAVSDEFAGYNVGDTISILHDNQMGEPEKYKVLLKTFESPYMGRYEELSLFLEEKREQLVTKP